MCGHAFSHAKQMHVQLYECDLQLHGCTFKGNMVADSNMICICAVAHFKKMIEWLHILSYQTECDP